MLYIKGGVDVRCVQLQLVLRFWADVKAALKQFKILHLCQFPGYQCLGPYPFMLPIARSLCPSLRTLFPFDHIPAKACSAIYSRVVLFYPPVSICSALKYRGLPACWRQQCRAAEGWLECGRGEEKERQTERNWMIQKGIGLKDARRASA